MGFKLKTNFVQFQDLQFNWFFFVMVINSMNFYSTM